MNDNNSGTFLGGIVIVVIVGILIWGAFSRDSTENSLETRQSTIRQAIDSMSSEYSTLLKETTDMIQSVDNECVWMSDNLSDEIGEYCAEITLSDYAFLNSGNFSLDEDDYFTYETNEEALNALVEDANTMYNDLSERASISMEAMENQCSWLQDNISETVGERCFDTISGYEFNSSPYSVGNYQIVTE